MEEFSNISVRSRVYSVRVHFRHLPSDGNVQPLYGHGKAECICDPGADVDEKPCAGYCPIVAAGAAGAMMDVQREAIDTGSSARFYGDSCNYRVWQMRPLP